MRGIVRKICEYRQRNQTFRAAQQKGEKGIIDIQNV
jgi:hypothetical protein